MGNEPFEELQDRCVVEHLRTNTSASTPRRGDNHRNPIAKTDRALSNLMRRTILELLVSFDVLHAGVDAVGYAPGVPATWARGNKWRHVIEIAIILIVSQDEDGLFPHGR